VKAEPFDWNVVVVGYWNPAILTPKGIAQRLLQLEEGTPIAVEVPIDGLGPSRVKHEKITVIADPRRLTVAADIPKWELLAGAMTIASNAISALPETPLSAAGFNIRTKLSDAPSELLELITVPFDAYISDEGLTIKSRSLQRALVYKKGTLNLIFNQDEKDNLIIQLNFDRASSSRDDLLEWLKTPIKDIEEFVSKAFQKIPSIQFEEVEK